jgi:hypothetical protein
MKIGLVGASNQMRGLPFDAQRTINMYPVFDDTGKESAALYGTPGLSLFASVGNGPIRAMFYSGNGRAFVISGASLMELYSDGTSVLRGSIALSDGNLTIDENALQLVICDGGSLYVLVYSTNAFAKVSDADLPSCGTVTIIDNTAVVNKNNSGSFYISAAGDCTTWDALDFATAESSPDKLLRVLNAIGQLWLFGDRTTEIWTNTKASSFPFERISGGKIDTGILAPFTALPVDNGVFWVGRDSYGSGVVYKAQGFTPQRISTDSIEYVLAQCDDLENMKAWAYQQEGHFFYVLTGGGLQTSLVYDIATQLWHERAYLNENGILEQHLGSCHISAFGKNLVGDRTNSNVYSLDLDVYSDNEREIVRERVYTHFSQENQLLRFNSLEIDMETGVGLQTGQGYDPKMLIQISKDKGKTWCGSYEVGIGKAGEYNKTVRIRRIGIVNFITFRIRITDPIKVCLTGSYLR